MAETVGNVLRIFISSPGDVQEERHQARLVVTDLQRLYPDVTLQPVLWEDLALPVTASFQQTIDVVLRKQPIHIAIFILWSRLGSELGPTIKRPDGSRYRSGTEREFDLMLAAFEQSGRKRPLILAYTRNDDDGFGARLKHHHEADVLNELIRQRELTRDFIREQFHDAEGFNYRAYQVYSKPHQFRERLRVHLSEAIDDSVGAKSVVIWREEPYRGLKAFDVSHAPIFHGRSEETHDLMNMLRDQHDAGCAFVVIVGASGSGKSSLARAGVGAEPSPLGPDSSINRWQTAAFIPSQLTGTIFERLAETICGAMANLGVTSLKSDSIAKGLEDDPALTVLLSLLPALEQAADGTDDSLGLLLILDQLEELWTDDSICPDHREPFLKAVESLVSSDRIAAVATLRSDFYGNAQKLPTFLTLKGKRGHFDLQAPGSSALRRIITVPARMAGLIFEKQPDSGRSLDEIILEDVANDPNLLPMLQFALAELYHQRDAQTDLLTIESYHDLGGIEGVIGKRAEAVFQSLPSATQAALDEILPHLVSVNTDRELVAVRKRSSLNRLCQTSEARELTNRLVEARLLVVDRSDDAAVVSFTHDTVLRSWARIRDWVDRNQKFLQMRGRIEQQQSRWVQSKYDDSLLLPPGLPLEEGRELLQAAGKLVGGDAREFLAKSIQYNDRRKAIRHRRRMLVVSSLSVLAIVAALFGGFAWVKQNEAEQQAVLAKQNAEEAERQRFQAEMNARKANTQRVLANANADEARQQRERAQRRLYLSNIYRTNALLDSGQFDDASAVLSSIPFSERQWEAGYLNRRIEGVSLPLLSKNAGQSFHWSSNGDSFFFVGDDGPLQFDARTGRLIRAYVLKGVAIGHWDISTDDRLIAICDSNEDEVSIWELESETKIHSVAGSKLRNAKIQFSPTANQLSIINSDRTVILWDFGSDQSQAPISIKTKATSASFSPGGRKIATCSKSSEVEIWSTRDGSRLGSFQAEDFDVRQVVYSPDGKRIAGIGTSLTSGGSVSELIAWDAKDGGELLRVTGNSREANLSFSPDGRHIAFEGEKGAIDLWDLNSGRKLREIGLGNPLRVMSIAFSPDGRRIVSDSDGKGVRMWSTEDTEAIPGRRVYTDMGKTIAIHPKGHVIASSGSDGRGLVWDLRTGAIKAELVGHESEINCIAFDPSGSRLATAGKDKVVRLWDSETGRAIHVLHGNESEVLDVAFGPDGQRVTSVGYDKRIRVWDTSSGRETLQLELPWIPPVDMPRINCVAFSPDGKWIISGGGHYVNRYGPTGTIRIWDADSGDLVRTLDRRGVVQCMDLSPDGRWMVDGVSTNGLDARLGAYGNSYATAWKLQTGEETMSLAGRRISVHAIDISPNSNRIVIGFNDRPAGIWDAEAGREILKLDCGDRSPSCVLFDPGQRWIVSSCDNGDVVVFDSANARQTQSLYGSQRSILSVAASRDGKTIVSGGHGDVRLWDVDLGQQKLLLGEYGANVSALDYSSDDTKIVGACGKAVRVWDAASGDELLVIEAHEAMTESVRFSADDRYIISRDEDDHTKVWNAETGSEILDSSEIDPDNDKAPMSDPPFTMRIDWSDIHLVRYLRTHDLWAEAAAFHEAWAEEWSRRDATQAEKEGNWFAARFHLRQLSRLRPKDASVTERLTAAEQALDAERQ